MTEFYEAPAEGWKASPERPDLAETYSDDQINRILLKQQSGEELTSFEGDALAHRFPNSTYSDIEDGSE